MKKFSCSWLLMSAVAIIGCGKSESTTAPTAGTAAPAATGTAPAGSVAGTPTGKPTAVVTDGVGTEAGEVVALFLDSLRRGDETAANSVLTAQAQSELAKTDYVIQPLGTPEGKYKIGRVGFVDGDTTTGLVECLWSEPSPVAGEPPIEMDIVCEVHKEAQGWRISGLAVKMAGTEETLVLDFEDAKSLQQALEGASQPAQPQVAGGQAAPAQVAPGQVVPGQVAPGQVAPGQVAPAQIAPPQAGQFAGGQPAPAGLALPQMPSAPNMPATPNMSVQPAGAPASMPQLPQLPTQIALPPSGAVNR